MDTVDKTVELVSSLTPAKKADVLQFLLRDLGEAYPGVEGVPGVCGGEACVVRTRIPMRSIFDNESA